MGRAVQIVYNHASYRCNTGRGRRRVASVLLCSSGKEKAIFNKKRPFFTAPVSHSYYNYSIQSNVIKSGVFTTLRLMKVAELGTYRIGSKIPPCGTPYFLSKFWRGRLQFVFGALCRRNNKRNYKR